jgi:nicotinate-nucleotide adenylyltransferase
LRIGILGGVFNPPHLGHLVCGQEALVQLGIDRVLLVPVGEAPHRAVDLDAGPETRVDLCQAAVAGDERFGVSRVEVDREGPSYTVDTLRALGEGTGGEDELVVILGGDQAAELRRWHDPGGVLSLAEVAVTTRGNVGPAEVRTRLADLRGAERLRFFSMPRIDVSSTLVRARVAEGLPIRYLVPDPVEALITERGLYQAEVGAR